MLKYRCSYYLLKVTSGLLAGVMGYRFFNTGKFMPAGLVFGLRYYFYGLFRAIREREREKF